MITKINDMKRTTADDVVTTVHFKTSVRDGDYFVCSYGTQAFTRDADSPTLVAYADLTEATVVSWLTLEEGLETRLLAEIEDVKTPTEANGVPW